MEHVHRESSEEHAREESIVVKKVLPNEMLAIALAEQGIPAQAVKTGTHPIEKQEYYSHKFGLNSKFVTNKGVIRISGKNFDLVQVLERN